MVKEEKERVEKRKNRRMEGKIKGCRGSSEKGNSQSEGGGVKRR